MYAIKNLTKVLIIMWAVKGSWSSIMTPRFLAVLVGTRDIDIDVMVDDLFGWEDHQLRFGQVQLKWW